MVQGYAQANTPHPSGWRPDFGIQGGDSKAEMSALYHTFIAARPLVACKARTCQMTGMSVLKYFKSLFSEIAKGRTDYENMLPMTIGLCKAV